MNCPVCEERMREIQKCGVNIDICPSCKGVWLDKGELEKLIELSATDALESTVSHMDSKPTEHYENHSSHDHGNREYDHKHGYGNHKRRGSWLVDILSGLGGGDD